MKNSIIIFTLIFFILIGCGKKQTTNEPDSSSAAEDIIELTDEQYKTVGIQIGATTKRQISGTIKVSGMLDVPPQQKVSITLPLGGFLKDTKLLQGMKVNKGELIASVENPEFIQMQQDYLDTKSQMEYAKAEYERQEILAKENVNATKTWQQAKSTYYSLLSRLNGIGSKLKLIHINPENIDHGNYSPVVNIYSPITGFVTKINANIGNYLQPTDVLFEIVDTKHLHAEITVFEKDINKLQIGQKVMFRLGNEDKEREATIHLIGREIRNDRSISVHCHLTKEDPMLIPGTYLTANIETGENMVDAIQDEAIIKYQGKYYVFIEKNRGGDRYLFYMKEVQIGESDNGFTEIQSGISGQEANKIVIQGSYDLLATIKNGGEN